MNCPKCGKQIQSGAAFCMHCGQAVSAGQPKQTTQMQRPTPFAPSAATPAAAMPVAFPANNVSGAFDQQRRRTAIIVIALSCIAALFATGVALKSMGLIGATGQTPEEKLLMAQGRVPGEPALVAVGRTPDAPLQAVAEKPAEMPDDIYKWLEHLRISEEKRTAITMSQLTTAYTEKEKSQLAGGVDALKDLLNGIDDPNSEMHPPTEKLGALLKQMHDECRDVLAFFDSMPPPKECIPIRDAYDQALNEEAGQMGDIADHIAAGDVEKLLKMEGKSAQGIDSAGAKTDRLVGEICDKYHKRRWFDIASDIKSSPIFGSGF
jgi:hypothetical protein